MYICDRYFCMTISVYKHQRAPPVVYLYCPIPQRLPHTCQVVPFLAQVTEPLDRAHAQSLCLYPIKKIKKLNTDFCITKPLDVQDVY